MSFFRFARRAAATLARQLRSRVQGNLGLGAWAERQEPMGLPCIVQAAGRPFPPPRARPVISGVVDFVGYAPVFSAASISVYGPRDGAELSLKARVQTISTWIWQEQAMNWDRVEGNWKEFKGKAQQKWGKLTNDDLDVIEGKRTELAGRLQQRYGVAKDEAERDIDTWLNGVN